MLRHHRTHLLIALATFACAGVSPEDGGEPVLVGANAKLDGNVAAAAYVCRIEPGEGDAFFGTDTLRCEAPEGAVFVPSIDVFSRDGVLGSIRLEEGPGAVVFHKDRYPLTVRASGYVSGEPLGLEGVRLETELVIDSPADWASARGPALPFQIFALDLEARVSLAEIRLEPYALTAGSGVRFQAAGVGTDVVEVRPQGLVLRGGETRRVVLVGPTDGSSIRGSVVIGDSRHDFELDRGGPLVVTADGLVPRQGLPPVPTGGELVRCSPVEGGSSCATVSRAGVVLSEASVTADGSRYDLGTEGAAVLVPSASVASARVVIGSGIEGIDLSRFGTIEGELVEAEGARVLDLPFSLLHVRLAVAPGDVADFDGPDRHVVTFTRAIAGAFESSDYLSIRFDSGRSDTWIATTHGVREVRGRLVVFTAAGATVEHEDVVLQEGELELTSEGLRAPVPIEGGAELARCWLSPEAQLQCHRIDSPRIQSARVILVIERIAREIALDLGAGHRVITSLGSFLPVGLTVEVSTVDGGTSSATVRLTAAGELPESAPLIVSAR